MKLHYKVFTKVKKTIKLSLKELFKTACCIMSVGSIADTRYTFGKIMMT